MKNILKKIMTGSLIMIAAMGLITPITAQATDETVIIDKEEYAEYKEYQNYKELQEKYGENIEKEYKKYNDNLVEIENISEDRYNKENDKSEKRYRFSSCIIVFILFILFLVETIQSFKDKDFDNTVFFRRDLVFMTLLLFILLAYLVSTIIF